MDQLLQKLRSHLYQSRYKHSSPSAAVSGARRRRGGLPATPTSESESDRLRQLLLLTTTPADRRHHRIVDDLQTDVALLELLKAAANRPEIRAEVTVVRSAATQPDVGNGDLDNMLRSIEWSEDEGSESGNDAVADVATGKRAAFVGAAEIRSPRDIHPVYLGMGQSAASAALNTYASLLADDKRRESSDQHSSNPVRFIGKR